MFQRINRFLSSGRSMALLIFIAAAAGVIFGSLVGPWAGNVKVIGDVFIRLVQMSVVLLVMTAVSSAIGKVGGKDAGRMGFHTFKWIIFFTLVSSLVGLALGLIIKPGEGVTLAVSGDVDTNETASASLTDTLLGFVPTNIFESMANGDMVPCIVFAILFGLALGGYTRETGNSNVADLIEGINAVVMRIIGMVMKIAPIGVFCLLADVAGVTGFAVIRPMLAFLGALAIGDLIQFIAYAALTGALCRVNPLLLPGKFAELTMLAATTTSSAICLPTEIRDSVEKFGVSPRVANFTGPINMSMNSVGAVQCYVLAILFMSQSTGVTLTPGQIGLSILLSCLMCMGTIVVPGGMIVTYTFLATSLGLPLESIAILIGIDWFSGIFRTVMNVNVDVMVAMLVANRLGELDREVYAGRAVEVAA